MRQGLLISAMLLASCVASLGAPLPRPRPMRGASAVSSDTLAGVSVTCADFRGGPAIEIQAQRLLAGGAVDSAWSPNGTKLCLGTTSDAAAAMVSDGAGGAIVVWADDRSGEADLYAQRFTSSGAVAAGWPADGLVICGARGAQQDAALCSDGAGGAIVAWQDFRDDGSGDLFVQRVNAGGLAQWVADGVPLAVATGEQSAVACATDGQGGALMLWQDRRDGEPRVWFVRLSSAGEPLGTAAVLTNGSGAQQSPRIASDQAGGAYVAWGGGASGALTALRIGSQGQPAAGWPTTGVEVSGAGAQPNAAALVSHGNDGATLAWSDRASGHGDIRAQRVNGTGSLQWGSGVVLSGGAAEQFAPAAVADNSGGVIVAWEDHRLGQADIIAARVTAAGALAWDSAGVAVCRLPGEQFGVALATDGAGGALATWSDARRSGRAGFVRAQPAGGPAPRLTHVETGPGRARLTYQTTAGDARVLQWQRRTDAEPGWRVLREAQANAEGELALEDRGVTPGALARYRLAQPLADGELLYAETSVAIPVAVALALKFAAVEGRGLRVAFALSTNDRAELEILDVQGRRVWNEAVGHLGAGEHDLRLAFRGAPGLYFVRLHQNRQTLSRRVMVVR